MKGDTRTTKLAPQTRRAQGGVGAPHLHRGGAGGNPTGRRDANDPGTRRSGDGSAGTSPSQQGERKDADWTSRQGGSQDRDR
jgi:hypothetical protein